MRLIETVIATSTTAASALLGVNVLASEGMPSTGAQIGACAAVVAVVGILARAFVVASGKTDKRIDALGVTMARNSAIVDANSVEMRANTKATAEFKQSMGESMGRLADSIENLANRTRPDQPGGNNQSAR